MTSPRSVPALLASLAIASTLWGTSHAAAQSVAREYPRPDVLILETAAATEDGCSDGSYRATGVCMLKRLEKADRWLTAVVNSCIEKAENREREYSKDFRVARNLPDTLRQSQVAFERYRDVAAKLGGEMAYPGLLAAAEQYGIAYKLTVERATMLLRRFSNLDPPDEVDLKRTDWCE
jgi:uncharacterized protein YecT (DUF1311 family)